MSKILLTIGVICLIWNPSLAFSQSTAIAGSLDDLLAEQPEEATTSKSATLPVPVQSAVLEAAARRTSRTVAAFQVLEAQERDWSDGCLGIPEPGRLCTQQIVPGWQVTVTDGVRNWVYRTDDDGDRIKLESAP